MNHSSQRTTEQRPKGITDPTVEISDSNLLVAEPLVSICMLTYNHERYISDAIDGIMAQNCSFSFELIIGEDCSTDRTLEIVLLYKDKYPDLIRVLTSKSNVGMHSNFERCVDASKGQFVAFCEGDDYWHHPKKLQMQMDLISQNPNATLCHTEYDRRIGFRIKRNRHLTKGVGPAMGEAYADLLCEWTVSTATSLYPKRIVDEFRTSCFYDRLWPFADYNLALYASTQGMISYLATSTATWRRISGSASNSGPTKSLAMHQAATECRRRFMKCYPLDSEISLRVEKAIQKKSLRLAFWAERIDIYLSSLNWIAQHRFEARPLIRSIELFAMRMVFPIRVLNRMRGLLRAIAEIDFRHQ